MFGPHSKLISAVPAWFKANFSLFRPPANTIQFGRYHPILTELARFSGNQPELEPSRSKSQKKKKLRRGTDTQAAASDAGAAPILPCPCIIGFLNTPQTLEKHETKSLSSITFAIKMFSPKYFCPKEMEP